MKVIRLGMEEGTGRFFCGESKITENELRTTVSSIVADFQEEGMDFGPSEVLSALKEKELVDESTGDITCIDITI